jgi:hypothetical protein
VPLGQMMPPHSHMRTGSGSPQRNRGRGHRAPSISKSALKRSASTGENCHTDGCALSWPVRTWTALRMWSAGPSGGRRDGGGKPHPVREERSVAKLADLVQHGVPSEVKGLERATAARDTAGLFDDLEQGSVHLAELRCGVPVAKLEQRRRMMGSMWSVLRQDSNPAGRLRCRVSPSGLTEFLQFADLRDRNPMTRLGIEPRTYGLKVRCSTN